MNELETKEMVAEGINKVNTLVKGTYGQYGGNVIIKTTVGERTKMTKFTKDGYSVAISVNSSNEYEKIGIGLACEVADKVKRLCGDATSTAIILFSALVNNILLLSRTGVNRKEISKMLRDDLIELNDKIGTLTVIKDDEAKLKRSVVIASKDEDLGELIYGLVKTATPAVAVKMLYTPNKEYYTISEGHSISMSMGDIEEKHFDEPTVIVEESNKSNKTSKEVSYDKENTIVFSLMPIQLKKALNISLLPLGSLVSKEVLKVINELAEENAFQNITIKSDGIQFIVKEDKKNIVEKMYDNYLHMIPKDNEGHVQEFMVAFLQPYSATLYLTAMTETDLLERQDRAKDGINNCRSVLLYGAVRGRGETFKALANDSDISNVSKAALEEPCLLLKDNDINSYDPAYSIGSIIQVIYNQAILFAEIAAGGISEETEE